MLEWTQILYPCLLPAQCRRNCQVPPGLAQNRAGFPSASNGGKLLILGHRKGQESCVPGLSGLAPISSVTTITGKGLARDSRLGTGKSGPGSALPRPSSGGHSAASTPTHCLLHSQ
jgi:hypothetical protein